MAQENPTWGCGRIEGALKNLGLTISDTTIGSILREYGMEPAPDRERTSTWKTFLKAHWEVLAAVDFTTVEMWTPGNLVTFYMLIAMRLSTRRIQIAGVTPNPNAAWVQQVARNLTDCYDGFLRKSRYVLVDRDTNCLAPGWFRTAQNQVLYENTKWYEYICDRIPVKRPGQPTDLDGHVSFLRYPSETPVSRAWAEFMQIAGT